MGKGGLEYDKRRGKYTPRSRQAASAALGSRPTQHLLVHHPQEVPHAGWGSSQSKNESRSVGRDQRGPVRNPLPAPQRELCSEGGVYFGID